MQWILNTEQLMFLDRLAFFLQRVTADARDLIEGNSGYFDS